MNMRMSARSRGVLRHGSRRLTIPAVVLVSACAFAAPGLTQFTADAGAASATTDAGLWSALPAGYHGPEASLPESYPKPTLKAGAKCSIGYLDPLQAIAALNAEQNGAAAEAKQLGCQFRGVNGLADPNTQVTEIDDLVSQGVNVLIVNPTDPTSLAPSLNKAIADGVKVVSMFTPGIANQPVPKWATTEVLQGYDVDAYASAKQMAAVKPGARFGLIGYAAPAPSLTYFIQRIEYWGKKFGLKFVGEVEGAATGTPADGVAAAQALIAKAPSVQAIFAYNDTTDEAAAAVVRQDGKHILVAGSNGETAALAEVKSGTLAFDFSFPWVDLGRQGVIAAYDLVTKQHLPLPLRVRVGGTLVTKKNVKGFPGV